MVHPHFLQYDLDLQTLLVYSIPEMQWKKTRQRTPNLLYKIRLIKFIYQYQKSYATIHNLEGNRPSNIDVNFKEIPTIINGVATTSPSPPRPALA
jgi:hypothetical protein